MREIAILSSIGQFDDKKISRFRGRINLHRSSKTVHCFFHLFTVF